MCTLTWARSGDGLELRVNRDEHPERRPARPPVRGATDGTAWIAPIDADAGGSWVGVNERGVAVVLLNGPPDAPVPPGRPRSRGLLVLDALAAADLGDVADRVRAAPLDETRAFRLVAHDGGAATALDWDGVRLEARAVGDGDLPFVSSGSEEALRARREHFRAELERRGGLAAGWLLDYHRSHVPERGPRSVCMHRGVAATVSHTLVRLEPGRAALEYAAGPACAPTSRARLALDCAR